MLRQTFVLTICTCGAQRTFEGVQSATALLRVDAFQKFPQRAILIVKYKIFELCESLADKPHFLVSLGIDKI